MYTGLTLIRNIVWGHGVCIPYIKRRLPELRNRPTYEKNAIIFACKFISY